MPKLVWLNGEVMPLESAVVPAADHAHLYGDGLFEGIRIYNGKVFKFDEHLDRLYHGINYLGFDMKMSKKDLHSTVLDVCKQAGIQNGYIRLNVTRGTGLGLDPKNIKPANVMIMINELALYPPEAYEIGLKVITSHVRVIPADSLDPRVKAIGRYVSNIFAKQDANRQGAGEALMLNHQGQVAECTGDNIFLVNNRVIRTPHPSCGILAGITRQTMIEIARKKGYTVEETIITPYEVYSAEEVFLTGTACEVIPMVSLDNRAIGCGKPGQVTQELIAAFRESTQDGTTF